MPACFALRRVVFCEEQGVSEDLEIDGLDDACWHVGAWAADDTLVGTARLRTMGPDRKAERVAVAAAWRRHGVGRALMTALEQRAAEVGARRLILNAQRGALPFYDALGYRRQGPMFEEAGIPHQQMWRPLP